MKKHIEISGENMLSDEGSDTLSAVVQITAELAAQKAVTGAMLMRMYMMWGEVRL
jgi:hypothetical protein